MYAWIVRRQVRGIFDQINAGNYLAMVDGLAPHFDYRFHGDHALGGHRTSRVAMIQWWERVTRLLPGAQFAIDDVLVNGGPWRTRIAVRAQVSGVLPDGGRYDNTVFQFLTLRWGKVTSVETLEDLEVLARALNVVAAEGNAEATAAPING